MSEQTTCGQTTSASCAQSGCAFAPLSLALVQERFAREAQPGVCDTGRYRMPFFSWGAGPPLVCIHGVSDTSHSFLAPIAHLSEHYRCIAYDLPSGHGDGAKLGRYRHDDLVADLWALLDHLGVDRAYAFGASFGATVALKAMRERPARLPRAVLQGGVAYRPLRRAEYWLSWLARWLPGSVKGIPRREKILELVHKSSFAHQPDEVWRSFVDCTAVARLAALGHQAQWLHRLDLREALPQIAQPVLLVWGDQDHTMPMSQAELLQSGLPNAGLAVIEGAGHVPCYTHPEAVAELVRRFLTPPGAGCPGQQNCAQHGASECTGS